MPNLLKRLCAGFLFCIIAGFSLPAVAYIVHVTPAGGDVLPLDGRDWEHALDDLQLAAELAATQPEREVHAGLGDYGGQIYTMDATVAGVKVLGGWNRNSNNRVMPDYIQYTTLFTWTPSPTPTDAEVGAGRLEPYESRILNPYGDPTMTPNVLRQGDPAVVRQIVDYPDNMVTTFDGFWIQNPGGKDNNWGWSQHGVILRQNGVVSNCWISNCEAHWGAGAVLEGGGTLDTCDIFNNLGRVSYLHFRADNNRVHLDKWAGRGAGVYYYSGGTIVNSKIRESTVQDGNSGQHSPGALSWGMGGGVYFDQAPGDFLKPNAPEPPDPNHAPTEWQSLINSTVDACISQHWGGGIEAMGDYPIWIDSSVISNNQADVWGGGLDLTVAPRAYANNSIFSGNRAPQGAGAYIANAHDFTYCTFSGNVAINIGGGAYIIGNSGFINCLVEKNEANEGGGVYYRGGNSGTNLFRTLNTTFRENTATSGGGVYAHEAGAQLLEGTVFEGNTATNGGALSGWFSFYMRGATIRNNTADLGGGIWTKFGGLIENTIIEGNSSNVNGGGVFGSDGTNIHASYIANNASTGNGGGIFTNSDTVKISSSVVANNLAGNNGGGIYCDRGGTITNCTIVNNLSQNNGGGMYIQNGYVYNTALWNNNAANLYPELYTSGQRSEANYNAVLGGKNTVTNIDLSDTNYSPKGPQFINPNTIVGPDPNWAQYDWNVSDTSILINAGDNTAVPGFIADDIIKYKAMTDILGHDRIIAERVDIGAYENTDTSVVLYVTQTGSGDMNGYSWRNALADLQYAVDSLSLRRDPLTNVLIGGEVRVGTDETNLAVFQAVPYEMKEGVRVVGGYSSVELYCDPNKFTTFLDGRGNSQILRQPQAFIDPTYHRPTYWSSFTFRNGSNAGSSGGAAVVRGNGGIIKSVFTNNTADNGGAVAILGGFVDSCVAYNNTAILDGGAFHLAGVDGTLSNTLMYHNNAQRNGGGAYAEIGTLSQLVANQNNAVNGGGIYVGPGTGTPTVLVENATLNNNTASQLGGGLFFDSPNNFARSITSQWNHAANGGGVHFVRGIIRYALIGANTAQNGGGVSASTPPNSAEGRIDNSLISNNYATAKAGGYYSETPAGQRNYTPLMANCTVVNNRADSIKGCGVTNTGNTYNTVIWGNNNNDEAGTQAEYVGSNPPSSHYMNSAIFDYVSSDNVYDLSAINVAPDGPNFIAPNPVTGLDSNWMNYNWTPKEKSTSILINTGAQTYATGINVDLAGNPRTVATRVDIGAYESQYARLVIYVKPTASGSKDGYSWRSAFGNIDQGIKQVANNGGGEVHLAAGLYNDYTEGGVNIKNGHIILTEDVSLIGGYAQDGTTRDSYSFIDAENNGRPLTQNTPFMIRTLVDGLCLENGNTPEGGGALLRQNGIMQGCMVRNNMASQLGGGIKAENTEILNTIVANNAAKEINLGNAVGGGIAADSCVIIDALVVNNSADIVGGIQVTGASSLINATVTSNAATRGTGGVQTRPAPLTGSLPSVLNCLIWHNSELPQIDFQPGTSAQYCAVQNAPGQWISLDAGNETLLGPKFFKPNPKFGNDPNWALFNWELTPNSRCVDYGNNSFILPYQVTTDVTGKTRIYQNVVDIGAIETHYSKLTVNVGSGSGRYMPGDIISITADNLGQSYEFKQWSGDIQYLENPRSRTTLAHIPAGRNVTVAAEYEYKDIIITGPGVIIPIHPSNSNNGENSTSGIKPGIGGGSDPIVFTKGTQLYAKDVSSYKPKKYKLMIVSPLPANQLSAVLNAIIPLYNKQELKNLYKRNISATEITHDPTYLAGKNLELWYKMSGQPERQANPKFVQVKPPMILSGDKTLSFSSATGKITIDPNLPTPDTVMMPNGIAAFGDLELTAQTDSFFIKITTTSWTELQGINFGQKFPKVWLEYTKAGQNKITKMNLKVDKQYPYPDAMGKPSKSCTNPKTGAGKIKVTAPPSVRTKLPTGYYTLVLDNGSGLSTTSVYLEVQPSAQP